MSSTRWSGVIDTVAARSPRRGSPLVTPGTNDQVAVRYGSSIQIEIVRGDGIPLTLVLRGELDITSMEPFEQALITVLAENPLGLRFDLTQCQFVSARGYDAMGRVSLTTPVEVRSRTDLAARIFSIYGYDEVVHVTVQGTALDGSL